MKGDLTTNKSFISKRVMYEPPTGGSHLHLCVFYCNWRLEERNTYSEKDAALALRQILRGLAVSAYDWEKMDLFTVWKFYFENISRVFLEYSHSTENVSILWNWTKLWKSDFFTFFCNISKVFPYSGRGSIFVVYSLYWVGKETLELSPQRKLIPLDLTNLPLFW